MARGQTGDASVLPAIMRLLSSGLVQRQRWHGKSLLRSCTVKDVMIESSQAKTTAYVPYSKIFNLQLQVLKSVTMTSLLAMTMNLQSLLLPGRFFLKLLVPPNICDFSHSLRMLGSVPVVSGDGSWWVIFPIAFGASLPQRWFAIKDHIAVLHIELD